LFSVACFFPKLAVKNGKLRGQDTRAGCDLVDSVERSHPTLALCFSEHVHAAANRKEQHHALVSSALIYGSIQR